MNYNQQLWEINAAMNTSFSGPGQNMRSILKKQPIPQRQMVSIAYVRDIDHIFYRTIDFTENYEDLQRRINIALRQEEVEPVPFSETVVHMIYLLRELLPVEKFYRVIITSSDGYQDGRIVVMVDMVDFGGCFFNVTAPTELYTLPTDLSYNTKQTVAGPCRLITDWTFDRDQDEDDEIKELMNLTTLRNLLPADGVFFAEIVQLPAPFTEFNVYQNDNYMHSAKNPQEEAMFYTPGNTQSINLIYQQMVQLQSTPARNNFSSSQTSKMQQSQSGGFNSSFRGARGGFNSSARGSTFTSSFGRGNGGGHGFGRMSRGGGGFGGGFAQ